MSKGQENQHLYDRHGAYGEDIEILAEAAWVLREKAVTVFRELGPVLPGISIAGTNLQGWLGLKAMGRQLDFEQPGPSEWFSPSADMIIRIADESQPNTRYLGIELKGINNRGESVSQLYALYFDSQQQLIQPSGVYYASADGQGIESADTTKLVQAGAKADVSEKSSWDILVEELEVHGPDSSTITNDDLRTLTVLLSNPYPVAD